jgi:hypothetical protein
MLDVKVGMTRAILCRQMHFEKAGDEEGSCNYKYKHTFIVAKGAIKLVRKDHEIEVVGPSLAYTFDGVLEKIVALEDDTLVFNIHLLRKEDGTVEEYPPLGETVIPYLERLTIKE